MKYRITVSENQMRVIQNALESFFRVRLGQYFDLATELAEYGYTYDKNNPDNDRLFNECIRRRNDSQEMFDMAYRTAVPEYKNRAKSVDVQNAIDIWHVIRHQFWKDNPNHSEHTVDSYPPFQVAGEPLCTVERCDEQ